MATAVSVDIVDDIKPLVYDVATSYAKKQRGLRYADIRLELSEGKGAVAENGVEKSSAEDYGISFGVRVLAGDRIAAPGYFGQQLGSADLDNLYKLLKAGVRHAYRRAMANAERKHLAKGRYSGLSDSLYDSWLAPTNVFQDTVPAIYESDPRAVPLGDVVRCVTDTSKAVGDSDSQVMFNFVFGLTSLDRELFCSSEGANIDQTFAMTQGMSYVVAQSESGSQELYDFIGHQRGWEVLEKGFQDEYIQNPDLMTFSLDLARDTVELANAEPLKTSDEDVVVVTDPHYNTLLVHEIVGHPVEGDRALKMETAYAGRTWLFKGLDDNQIGQQVASPMVNAYSDPTLPGYGHYKYDHEGTQAKKVVHINQGVFEGFMNSRQSAAILGEEPNGSYKATDAALVPLIRMSNTVFGPGQQDPQEMIRDVEHGYYMAGHRIPSIAESRENFRISAMKTYEIKNGELGQLYRNGGITADSRDFFMNVDGVGNDFRLYPIPNCGKGQPMQVKKLGNGGPTLRSRAKITGS